MRLLIAVSEYHRGGGFPRHGADLAVSLARRGHEVTVLTRRIERTPADEGITFRTYTAPGPGMLGPMASEPSVLGKILRAEAPSYDAMLSVGIPVLAPVWLIGPGTHRGFVEQTVRLMPRWSPRRLVEPYRPFHQIVTRWERAMLDGRHARGIIVAGERFKAEYTDLFGMAPESVSIIPHGVDVDAFRFDPDARARTRAELGLAPDEPLVLSVANRVRQKGLDVLARALHRLPQDTPWRAVFVGDGSRARALARATAALRARGRVALLGRVPAVEDYYSAADLLVFPTRYDPWGMAVTEALAAGLPVITTEHAGSAMAVNGSNGVVVDDVEDDAELAARIQTMLATQHDRAAVAASVAHLTWDACAEATERLLAPAREVARG